MLRPSWMPVKCVICAAVCTLVAISPLNAASPAPLPVGASPAVQIKSNLEATNGKFTDIVNALNKLLSQVIPAAIYTEETLREKNDLQELSARLVSLKLAQDALGSSVKTYVMKQDGPAWAALLVRARKSFRLSYALTSDLDTGKLKFFEYSSTIKENLISALTARQMVQSTLPDQPPRDAEDIALVQSLPALIAAANSAIDKTQSKLKVYIERRFDAKAFGP